jgi:alkylation response protein AidB-like acyl-CoA dehydrogenase
MDVSYPEHALAFGREVRAWLEANLPAGWFEPGFTMPAAERKRFFEEEWPRRMYAGGWICAAWPKEYGGRGLDLMENVVLAEEFARAAAPMRVSSLGEMLVGPTILRWGTEDQKHEFLPKILRGEIIWCQGFSEPASGSDLASLACEGVIEGDDIVVTGEKIWTSEAEDADYIFILVRTSPDKQRHAGISFLLMPMRQPGVEVIAKPQPDGSRGFNKVVFTGARCPIVNVVGGIDNGWKVAMTTLGFERGTSATTGYHRFRAEREELFASARRTGRAADPVVRQQLAQAWIVTEIMRVNGYRSLTNVLLDRNEPALDMTHKVFWSDYSQWSTKLAIDVLGMDGQLLTGSPTDVRPASVGLGKRPQVYEYPASPLQQSFFFARGESIYGGTSEIQRNLVAERVLGLPKGP